MVREHHLRVERTARYATLGEPGPDVRELWIACHGFAQLAARFAARFEPIAGPERLVVAPEALNRFYVDSPSSIADAARRRVGATWMTREEREAEIADYVGYLDRLYDLVRAETPGAPVTALGFSQGASTAFRWAALGRAPIARLVSWCGTVPPDVDLPRLADRLAGAPVVLVLAEHDEVVRPEQVEADAARLQEAGLACRVLRSPGGHAVDRATLVALAAG